MIVELSLDLLLIANISLLLLVIVYSLLWYYGNAYTSCKIIRLISCFAFIVINVLKIPMLIGIGSSYFASIVCIIGGCICLIFTTSDIDRF